MRGDKVIGRFFGDKAQVIIVWDHYTAPSGTWRGIISCIEFATEDNYKRLSFCEEDNFDKGDLRQMIGSVQREFVYKYNPNFINEENHTAEWEKLELY